MINFALCQNSNFCNDQPDQEHADMDVRCLMSGATGAMRTGRYLTQESIPDDHHQNRDNLCDHAGKIMDRGNRYSEFAE